MTHKKLTPEEEWDLQNGYAFHLSEGGQLTFDEYCEVVASVDKDWLTKDPVVTAQVEKAIAQDDTLLSVMKKILATNVWRR